jgi:membrane protease YdiL (CAAX protease family)
MQEPELNNEMISLIAVASALSLAAGFFLFQRHVDGRSLLAYEPRRRVPWGPLVLVIPLFFIFSSFLPVPENPESAAEPVASNQFAYVILFSSLVMMAFVPVAMLWLIAGRQANPRDLGLPSSHRQFWQDACRGVVGCLAALLPIMMVNFVLDEIFQPDQVHPLIDQLQNNGSTTMLLVGAVSAVLAAPLFEEFAYRVLLQGWLERLEDERLGFHATERITQPIEAHPDQAPLEAEETVDPATEDQPLTHPRHGWLAILPHGWTPILISSVMFGLAHLGHGVAPVPLVFFGIVLGYLYQRTHRIVPCVVAHMLFNAYSMMLLWLSMESST